MIFVNHAEQPIKRYSVKKAGNGWAATLDLDTSKVVSIPTEALWSVTDQIQYLKDNSISLTSSLTGLLV